MVMQILAHAFGWSLSAVGPLCSVLSPLMIADVMAERIVEKGTRYSPHELWKRLLVLGYISAEMMFYFWFKHKRRLAQAHHKPQVSTKERRKKMWDGEILDALSGYELRY